MNFTTQLAPKKPESEVCKLEKAYEAVELWWDLYGILMVWAQSKFVGANYLTYSANAEQLSIKDQLSELSLDSHDAEFLGSFWALNACDQTNPIYLAYEDLLI